VHSIPLHFAVLPVPHIAITVVGLPDTRPMPQPVGPFAFVYLTIFPVILSLPISLVVFELALVVALWSDFVPLAQMVVLPETLKPILRPNTHTFLGSSLLLGAAEVQGAVVAKYNLKFLAPG
jgi:hypothetical protein